MTGNISEAGYHHFFIVFPSGATDALNFFFLFALILD